MSIERAIAFQRLALKELTNLVKPTVVRPTVIAPAALYPNAVVDRIVRQLPTLPTLGAAGTKITDPSFGRQILRVTDPNTLSASVNASFGTPSAGHQLMWSKDGTKLYARGSSVTCLPFAFDPIAFTATRISGSGDGGLVVATQPEPQFSWVDDNIIYVAGENGTYHTPLVQKFNFVGNTYTDMIDLRAQGVTISNDTYCGTIASSELAPERIAAMYGGDQQDHHFLCGVFEVGNLSNKLIVDTLASTTRINGGSPVATNITLDFKLHHIQLDRTGRFAILETASADIALGKARKYVWDLQTNLFTAITVDAYAHSTTGWGDWINMDGPHPSPYDNVVLSWRNLTTPNTTRSLIRNPQTQGMTYIDGHLSWHNGKNGVLLPVFAEYYRSQDGPNDVPHNDAPRRAWDDEIVAIQTSDVGDTTEVYRFCHHRSIVRDDVDTNGVQPFYKQPRVNVRPQGDFAAFTSNWGKSLGTELGSYSPDTKRYDLFIVKCN